MDSSERAVGVGSLVRVTEGVEVGKGVGDSRGVLDGADSGVGCFVCKNPNVSWGMVVFTCRGFTLRHPARYRSRRRQKERIALER